MPQALDFMRPIIMEMCNNIGQYENDSTVIDNMAVMQKISVLLDDLLIDLDDSFGDSTSPSPLPKDIAEFMSLTETYSSVFATLRLQRLWITRYQTTVEGGTVEDDAVLGCFKGIVKWMDGCLVKLRSFAASLTRLINFWELSEDPPQDWHRLFLMQLALEDALEQPK
eukprot:CAMPEP_0181139992 /NCGR_PEP_ID=MMETSP1071-20121207/35075_1 /TAXON_ID=35127 /ORGANISM="Thalassiosira sp., Strain NH16" /LENGTH=167 /DNA_ID=CAMNT_0023226931 /DNA_START=294 /DNA_END=797 /DNA_ORIENTATION=-